MPSRLTPDDSGKAVILTDGDLDHDFYWAALAEGLVAWDIETSGLDWSTGQIGTCQVATSEAINIVYVQSGTQPKRLSSLLDLRDVRKVFHHAPFDLRFMVHHWGVHPRNVACTKVASKIAFPELPQAAHSLKPTLERLLGVEISKGEQLSDWLSHDLTPQQLQYAATDVKFLLDLYGVLVERCRSLGREEHLFASWAYLSTRVSLDLLGAGDVYTY